MYGKVQCRLVVCWWSVGGRLFECRLGVSGWSLGGQLVVGRLGIGLASVEDEFGVVWWLGVNWCRLVVDCGFGWGSIAGRFRFGWVSVWDRSGVN